MPLIADVTAASFAAFPVDRSYDLVSELAELDRYQGSQGIAAAADMVADRAERAGLRDVEVRRFPADAQARWWSFRAPRSWTPLSGTVDLLTPDGAARMVSFPELACSLATNSAPADLAAAPLVEGRGGAETVVLLPKGGPAVRLLIDDLAAAGAAGLITDVASPDGAAAAGRIELPRDTTMFGFSVPSAVMGELLTAARRGGRVRVAVRAERGAAMPLVHGLLPGRADNAAEILVLAHLCHPRPSANDNASGVAAAIGVAETLAALADRFGPGRRAVRFLWAPEFAGTAAYLHDHVGPAPELAIDLDMVGGMHGPLVVESPPGHLPSLLPALAERVLTALPTPLRSYSGAVPLRDWNWAVTPFAGGSDHAVLAGIGCPAVCVSHWPDPYRHTSLDTPDRVGRDQLRRAGTLAAAMVQFVRCAGPGDIPAAQAMIARSAHRRTLTIMDRATDGTGAAARLDPFAPPWLRGFLAHEASAARAAMRRTSLLLGGDAAAAAELPDPPTWPAGPPPAAPEASAGEVIRRSRPGPFNLQGVEDAASPQDRRWLIEHEQAYTEMLALALAIDDASPLTEVAARAAYSTWLPIDLDFARRFVQVLIASGWAETGRRLGSTEVGFAGRR
jgi:hypothetical protein